MYARHRIKDLEVYMTSKAALFFVFCALVAQSGSAQELQRINAQYTFEKSSLANNLALDKDVLALLKSGGVAVDGKSEIQVHEEKNTISLVCFECIVRSIHNEIDSVHSSNERTIK